MGRSATRRFFVIAGGFIFSIKQFTIVDIEIFWCPIQNTIPNLPNDTLTCDSVLHNTCLGHYWVNKLSFRRPLPVYCCCICGNCATEMTAWRAVNVNTDIAGYTYIRLWKQLSCGIINFGWIPHTTQVLSLPFQIVNMKMHIYSLLSKSMHHFIHTQLCPNFKSSLLRIRTRDWEDWRVRPSKSLCWNEKWAHSLTLHMDLSLNVST